MKSSGQGSILVRGGGAQPTLLSSSLLNLPIDGCLRILRRIYISNRYVVLFVSRDKSKARHRLQSKRTMVESRSIACLDICSFTIEVAEGVCVSWPRKAFPSRAPLA